MYEYRVLREFPGGAWDATIPDDDPDSSCEEYEDQVRNLPEKGGRVTFQMRKVGHWEDVWSAHNEPGVK